MSRKEREKKQQRVEETTAEKAMIMERRKQRLAPIYKMISKFAVALFVTILILYIGFIINGRLTPN